jgi:soluble lytic murein transglycosylase-like protein
MRLKALFVIALAAASPARAEIAVLANGETLKVKGHRTEGEIVLLNLSAGGEIGFPSALLRGFVPDEVVDEVLAAEGDLPSLARAAAERYGLDPELVLAVVGVESNFQAKAVSPKGAKGLMQLMPKTAAELGVADAFDPATNIDGGTRHLQALLRMYRGDVRRALAAYNAGAGAVARHGGVPPYRETQEYVRKVLRRYSDGQSPKQGP